MNYRHAFHAGNHADVLKHVVLLALCDALTVKPAPLFVWDVHAGAGVYDLAGDDASRTDEASGGIGRLTSVTDPVLQRYVAAIDRCKLQWGPNAYPGSPWLFQHCLRDDDRLTCTELHPGIVPLLRASLAGDRRIAVLEADGYAQTRPLLPPRHGETRLNRGIVVIDPPYEAQLVEFERAFVLVKEGLQRWPQGTFVLWYPVKQRRALNRIYREAAGIESKSLLDIELLIREDDSPLRLNGSGLFIWNAPWQFDQRVRGAVTELSRHLADGAASARLDWLRASA